jgi:hypothetical protein
MAVVSWRACRKYRQSLRNVAEGSLADFNDAFFPLNPWADVLRFSLQKEEPEAWRFQIDARGGVFRHTITTRNIVDAEVHLEDDQALKLKESIERWVQTAREKRQT